jgi:hypothetical protein
MNIHDEFNIVCEENSTITIKNSIYDGLHIKVKVDDLTDEIFLDEKQKKLLIKFLLVNL